MVTIKDVALRAGVNPSTVSRTLKDSSSISQTTKDKVRKAMKELGYVPNVAAQMLASGLTQSVGLVLPPLTSQERLSQPFFMEFITAINAAASKKSQTVSIATGESLEDLQHQVHLMHRQKRADGFIILYSEKEDPVKDYLLEHHLPFVVVGVAQDTSGAITYIDNDNRGMGRQAAEFLAEKGHQNILFVTDDLEGQVYSERYEGYSEAMAELNLPVYPSVVFDRHRAETLQDFMDRLTEKQATALVVIDDLSAVRIIQWLSFYQLRVPDDLSIISFNNSIYAKIIHPYLSSFDINIAELGRKSLEELLGLLEKPSKESKKILVPFHLKDRESVIRR
ncbi:LacI family DNA-binding transcriptional regulator [Streptococcus sp. DD13]|uniref:LacI family DNA-binding transcriptional regulator n=1 Tax=Streptococcus sp. DD13 TaxID=1777881 RepID=UPI000836822B|nr:LacI family DNA-binding transcriptional regulator [Streptococcus sp. DD13]